MFEKRKILCAVLFCVLATYSCNAQDAANLQQEDASKALVLARKKSSVVYDRIVNSMFSSDGIEGMVLLPKVILRSNDFHKIETTGISSILFTNKAADLENLKQAVKLYAEIEEKFKRVNMAGTDNINRAGFSGDPPSNIIVGISTLKKHLRSQSHSVGSVAKLERAVCLLGLNRKNEAVAIFESYVPGFEKKETRGSDTKVRNKIPQSLAFLRPDETAVFLLAMLKNENKEYDDAQLLCKMLRDSAPNSSVGYYAVDLAAHIYKKQGKIELAKKVLADRIARLEKDWPVCLGGRFKVDTEDDKRIINELKKNLKNIKNDITKPDSITLKSDNDLRSVDDNAPSSKLSSKGGGVNNTSLSKVKKQRSQKKNSASEKTVPEDADSGKTNLLFVIGGIVVGLLLIGLIVAIRSRKRSAS